MEEVWRQHCVRGNRVERSLVAAFWWWSGWMVWTLPLLSMLTGCQGRLEGSGPGESGVSVMLTADKRVYAQGEPMELSLRLINGSPQPIRLQFRTAQRYDFTLQDQRGQEVWRWSAARLFAQVFGEETVAPGGGELSYRITVHQQFPAGRYTVLGVLPASQGRMSASMEIEIH